MSDPNLYTIGWICAITTELVAARALLDERHDPPESVAQHDNNSYALGRMGRHNVVIAALPKSEYGTTAAATVARDMLSSFPNVRIGLMVGIGGGAPSEKHDIRLGDIVVGTRDLEAGKGGVIQYDYGKTIQDRAFTMIGSLNQAPQALLTAVANLEAQYLMEGHELNNIIEKALAKWPRLRKTHGRPSMGSDSLYHPHIVHPSMGSQTRCIDSCGEEPFHLVTRRQRDEEEDNPAIHYGLIASANQLMKDAYVRDRLAEETGVLCFEMEAAGLMNHFPCLIIRGICDYSDTHKNKEWQGFAAMAAAAYTKDLLGQIVPAKLESEKKLADTVDLLLEENYAQHKSVNQTKSAVMELKHDERIDRIQRWLSPPDASSIANHSRKIRQEGTGTWIFSHPMIQEWLLETRQHIWLHGPPGCGKTILATCILDHLEAKHDPLTLRFFFDFQDVRKQTLDAMLRGLIFQLYVLGGSASGELDALFKDHQNGCWNPSTSNLIDCFKRMIMQFEKVYLLLDALDESKSMTELIEWISAVVVDLDLRNVKAILLSREEEDLPQGLKSCIGEEGCLPLSKSSIDSDISAHVRETLQSNLAFKRWSSVPWVLDKISCEIRAKANGMFRWAACQLQSLENCLDVEMVETALDTLPQTLNETYHRILTRVPPNHKTRTLRLLQFLVHSRRPLTLQQTAEMLAVRGDGFDPANMMPCPREVVKLCPGFLTVHVVSSSRFSVDEENIETEELHLAHFSVKEYLLKCQDGFQFLNANAMITNVCLNYLDTVSKLDPDNVRRAVRYPFSDYAGSFCMAHALISEGFEDTAQHIAHFLQNPAILKTLLWFRRARGVRRLRLLGIHLSVITNGVLEFACYSGLKKVVEHLLDHGFSVNGATEDGALYAALDRGDIPIIQLLLDRGARFDVPRIVACAERTGNASIMRLLLDKGANVNSCSPAGFPILYYATQRRDVEMVGLLVEKGANVNTINPNEYSSTTLQQAVYERWKEGVELLLAHGADPNLRDRTGSTALLHAVRQHWKEGVELLLAHGADPNLRDHYERAALNIASQAGDTDIARMLLDKGAIRHFGFIDQGSVDWDVEAELARRGKNALGVYRDIFTGKWGIADSQWVGNSMRV
ncbi:ankyrin repeat protein [Colletotrichum kahawae]|uniref:Ankyrin repeat protein n=1 Tax=Colletotrichum kahawae TaxID=34407 RepID=A0AAE0D9N2_COLKA|nr:ankyrin repeat protein [Colletotrichum kahawae]